MFESLGGLEKGGQRVLESLVKEAAARNDCGCDEELQRLMGTISISLMRAWDRFLTKRRCDNAASED